KAERDVTRILELNPNEFNSKIRYAEILLSLGEIGKAERFIKEVLSVQNNNEQALTLLGYIFLTKLDTQESLSYFDKALSYNDSYAAAHLGKGLALIRRGDLDAGRGEIEIATHLAPNISLYRSY